MTAYKSIPKTLITLSLILSSTLGFSNDLVNHLYFFGGGGDPAGPNTIFDKFLWKAGDFAKNNKEWKTTISFNGGHSNTEKIIEDKFKNAENAGPFTQQTYQDQIASLIKKIESGEIKKGEQLLININTHGARKSADDKTHKIAFSGGSATELSNLTGATTGNLDNLEELADLAASKGVKLAIVDGSCFSGNTLNIKNKNTCVISASGPSEYSYAEIGKDSIFKKNHAFDTRFYSSFEKGKNLEELYLAARTDNYFPDFPMISTPEGRELADFIHNAVSPFLVYDNSAMKNSDFSKKYNVIRPDLFEMQVCDSEKKYQNMQESLKKVKDLVPLSYVLIKKEFSSLVKALEDYRNFQLEYENIVIESYKIEKDVKELISKYDPAQIELLKNYNPVEIVMMDYAETISTYQKLANISSGSRKDHWNLRVKQLNQMQVMVDDIKSKLNKDSLSKLDKYSKMSKNLNETWVLAATVSRESKKLYDSLYKQMMKLETNPCRDFVL